MMLGMMDGQSTGATTDKELLSPDTAIVFWRLAHTFFVAAELALALFVGALAVLALRRLALTRWLGWFGLAVTILLLIPPVGWLAVLFLLPLWLVATSVVLWRWGRCRKRSHQRSKQAHTSERLRDSVPAPVLGTLL